MFSWFNRQKEVLPTYVEPPPKAKQLPPRFSERLLQLEMDLDFDWNFVTLRSLLDLYNQAIEYFESIGDPKQEQYQTRMQMMLVREDVIEAMTNHTKPSKTAGVSESEFKKRKIQQEEKRKLVTPTKPEQKKNIQEERTAVKLLENQNFRERETSTSARNDLKRQDESLMQRIAIRRNKAVKTTIDLQQLSQNHSPRHESDSSAGTDRSEKSRQISEAYEKQKLVAEKKIKSQYSSDMAELENGERSAVVDMILNNMKQEMEEKIMNKLRKIDAKKAQEIFQLESAV